MAKSLRRDSQSRPTDCFPIWAWRWKDGTGNDNDDKDKDKGVDNNNDGNQWRWRSWQWRGRNLSKCFLNSTDNWKKVCLIFHCKISLKVKAPLLWKGWYFNLLIRSVCMLYQFCKFIKGAAEFKIKNLPFIQRNQSWTRAIVIPFLVCGDSFRGKDRSVWLFTVYSGFWIVW